MQAHGGRGRADDRCIIVGTVAVQYYSQIWVVCVWQLVFSCLADIAFMCVHGFSGWQVEGKRSASWHDQLLPHTGLLDCKICVLDLPLHEELQILFLKK
jgi:hypothetical protein